MKVVAPTVATTTAAARTRRISRQGILAFPSGQGPSAAPFGAAGGHARSYLADQGRELQARATDAASPPRAGLVNGMRRRPPRAGAVVRPKKNAPRKRGSRFLCGHFDAWCARWCLWFVFHRSPLNWRSGLALLLRS
jgi:hypothetical protein